ncbi:MAG: sensor histidine kinase, partial [Thermoleophilia bacterium]
MTNAADPSPDRNDDAALASEHAEEPFRAASAYARSLLEASLDPLVTISSAGKITDVNAATEKATGIAREKLIGTDFSDYFTEPQAARHGYEQVFAEGFVRDYPLALRHVSGAITEVLYNASVFRDQSGRVSGVFAAARDVTEQKRVEAALRASEQRFRTVADLTYNWEMWIGPDLTFVYVSPACERISGYSPAAFRADPELIERIVQADDRPAFELHRHLYHGGEKTDELTELQFRIVRADGEERWIDHLCRPVYGEDGSFLGRRITNRDVSELKRTQGQLAERIADLARSNADLEQFAYVASHDLQEPLRMVASYTQLLARRYQGRLDEDADEFIGYAVDGAKRLQNLINDLLAYSRVGTRGQPFAPVDCAAVFAEVVINLKTTIEESGAEVTSDPLPTVNSDRQQLVELFQNLISNAVKFHGPQPPRVHVSATRH